MIGLFAVTASGRRAASELAARLGPDAVTSDGPIGPALHRMWPRLDAVVVFLATGATVRLIAPLLRDKHTDPGVVCVDEACRFAVALAGGHAGGANALAAQVADVLGATPVVTTASDTTGVTPLDAVVEQLDASVDGDLAACGVAVLDGEPVRLVNPYGFPLPALPPNVSADADDPVWTIVLDDRRPSGPDQRNTLRIIPRTLVVGVGSASDVSRTAVTRLLASLDEEHGLDPRAVRAFATVDRKAGERGIVEAVQDHGFWHSADGGVLPLLDYPPEVLAAVEVPNPSEVVRAEIGTPSVAEAAALHAAGELATPPAGGGRVELAVGKLKGDNVTVAVARMLPTGRLAIIGLGPGAEDLRTGRAEDELRRASVVVGLDQYVEQVRHLLRPGVEVRATGLGQEEQRAAEAVALAESGRAVALIGSGDAGIYAMASPALEKAGAGIEVVAVPGVTAALAAAALLGAPLGHDHALISLSDLHTPWEIIERRVRAAAESDLVVCFYNPRSGQRDWQLARALEILAEHRPAATPVGAVHQAERDDQRVWIAPISEFDPAEVDMYTTVVAGSSQSTMVGGRMVTPRGYRWMEHSDVPG